MVGLGVLLARESTHVVDVLSCRAFLVTTATSSSVATTIFVPWATIVILLLVWCAFLVLITLGIRPPLAAATLTLIDGIRDIRLVQILCTVVSTLVGAECRRVLLLILVMIWLRVWPARLEVVGISAELALVLRRVISSYWSYRVLAKNFVKISYSTKRAIFMDFGAQSSVIDRKIVEFDLLICILCVDYPRELFQALFVLFLLALSDFFLLFLLGDPEVDAERLGSAERSLVI